MWGMRSIIVITRVVRTIKENLKITLRFSLLISEQREFHISLFFVWCLPAGCVATATPSSGSTASTHADNASVHTLRRSASSSTSKSVHHIWPTGKDGCLKFQGWSRVYMKLCWTTDPVIHSPFNQSTLVIYYTFRLPRVVLRLGVRGWADEGCV